MDAALEAGIVRLEAVEAIRQLCARSALANDVRDIDGVAQRAAASLPGAWPSWADFWRQHPTG
jgi:hypothetical protein